MLPSSMGKKRLYLSIEFTLIFVLIPIVLFFYRVHVKRLVIPALLVFSAVCLFVLLRDKTFPRGRLWGSQSPGSNLKGVLLRFVVGGTALFFLVYAFKGDLLFRFPRERFYLWLVVMVLYPLLSAYPQELIYRTFFFHRYKGLFPGSLLMMVVSGLSFGLVHLFFNNWPAPVFSTLGGVMFARTYAKTGSLLTVAIEHGLWGNLIFTLGLGWYFYAGSIR